MFTTTFRKPRNIIKIIYVAVEMDRKNCLVYLNERKIWKGKLS